MKTIKKLGWVIALVAVIIIVAVRLMSNKEKTQAKVYQYDKESVITVSVDTVHMQGMGMNNSLTGTFEPNRESKLSADIQGRITAVLVDLGSQVTRGQSLMQLDQSLFRLQLESVDIQIEGLQNDVNRLTVLAQADAVQGVQLEKAQLGLRTAKVQRATLLEQLNKTTIKAPFDGVVTAKLNEVGGFAGPGVPLLQLTEIGTLRFTVNVPEKDLALFSVNQSLPIVIDALPTENVSGKVIMIGSRANMGNSFPVQIEVKNTPKHTIKAGMFGRLQLRASETVTQLAVPSFVIQNKEGKKMVYLLKNGKAVLTEVVVGNTVGDYTAIEKGVVEGDIVITKGFIKLFDGANVVVK